MELATAWQRLAAVTELSFSARSGASTPTGWTGQGAGGVEVSSFSPRQMLFQESGQFIHASGSQSKFNNVYRWTATDDNAIQLEHLRFGPEHPVFLFAMKPQPDGSFRSVEPHLCRDDCYTAEMSIRADVIHLRWTIAGPRKNEVIEYEYR